MVTEQRREEFRRELTASFRLYARFYDLIEFVIPLLGTNPRLAVANSVPSDAKMILDGCTGNGAVLAALAKTHPLSAAYGLDLSPDMLRLAKRRISRNGLGNAQVFSGDCTRMPFPDRTFNAVATSYGLHEMPLDIRRASLAEACRVLIPGGMLVVIDWDEPRGILDRLLAPLRNAVEPGYIKELFGEGLTRLIDEAGFENIAVRRDILLSQLVTARKSR